MAACENLGSYLHNCACENLGSYLHNCACENLGSYLHNCTFNIGQVVKDAAFETSGGTPRQNEQLAYVYDHAGNLTYRTNNIVGLPLVQNFQVNADNELTSQTNGGKLTVVGTTTSTASSVKVNTTNTATLYGDATFSAGGMPLLTSYTAVAQDSYNRQSSYTANVNLSANTSFLYDANGNLTNDGLRDFAYDDENELIQVWVPTQWMSQFQYDGKMRMRIRKEFTWTNSAFVQTNEVHYVYDGNLVIQERDANNLRHVTYTRGLDLSSSLQGAGGIGGLLARTDNTSGQAAFYHSDGNGNVTMLVNSSNAIVGKYLYDAFGNVLSAAGLLANVNLYQFSSKEKHLNSGMSYYGYRFYDPNLQRWVSRDPLGGIPGIAPESSSEANLFIFSLNSPTSRMDPFGLWQVTVTLGNGLAGQATFGYEDGQFNAGAFVGVGEGFSFDFKRPGAQKSPFGPPGYQAPNSNCKGKNEKEKSKPKSRKPNFGIVADGQIGFKSSLEASSFISTSDIGNNEWELSVPSATLGEVSVGYNEDEGNYIEESALTGGFSFGESTFIGWGAKGNQ